MENISNYYQVIFKRLFNISVNILEEYQILLELERRNKKNSNDYINHYKILEGYLEEEKGIYSSLKNKNEIIYALLKKVSYFNRHAKDFIIPTYDNSLIYTRISLKLNDCLNNIHKNASPEIYALFSKFDLFSLIHFESILFALILFQKYLNTNPDLVLSDIFSSSLYSYSFMFPFIEDVVFKSDFTTPELFYSITEWLSEQTIVNKDSINNFKQKKFDQIINYMKKNNLNTLNYIFLLFYLKALSLNLNEQKTAELEELIKKSGLKKDVYTSLISFILGEESTPLIRKVSFQI